MLTNKEVVQDRQRKVKNLKVALDQESDKQRRLIAAAPKMYELLKAWVEAEQDAHFEEQSHDAEGCRYCESVAAIAKVEGRHE